MMRGKLLIGCVRHSKTGYGLLGLAAFSILLAPRWAHGDAFDNYTNDLLAKIPTAEGVQQL